MNKQEIEPRNIEELNKEEFDWILSLKKAYQEHVKRENLLQIKENGKNN